MDIVLIMNRNHIDLFFFMKENRYDMIRILTGQYSEGKSVFSTLDFFFFFFLVV